MNFIHLYRNTCNIIRTIFRITSTPLSVNFDTMKLFVLRVPFPGVIFTVSRSKHVCEKANFSTYILLSPSSLFVTCDTLIGDIFGVICSFHFDPLRCEHTLRRLHRLHFPGNNVGKYSQPVRNIAFS